MIIKMQSYLYIDLQNDEIEAMPISLIQQIE